MTYIANHCYGTLAHADIIPNAFVDQFRKELAVNEKPSPLSAVSSSGLCGHDFIKGFALSIESRNAVANGRKNIAVFDHFGFAPDRAMPRDNNGLVRHHLMRCESVTLRTH